MGFYEQVVPQVFAGKTKTYRLKSKDFKVGDKVAFENSQAKEIFGQGTIVNITETKVKDLPLQDKSHGATYDKLEELITAFKRHYPDKQVTGETKAYIYEYKFESLEGKWVQDQDVLDTWFSSALWTFSSLGWPEETEDLKYFHPTTVMETGYDIIFLWVARMIIMSTYLTGEAPFKTVYLHGMIRDKQGRKMSKSLDNGIDPVEMIEKFGADAVRLSIVVGSAPGNDVRIFEEKIAGYRNFANKIWNIARFVMQSDVAVGFPNPTPSNTSGRLWKADTHKACLVDQWILSKLDKLVSEVTDHLDKFEFSQAGEKIFEFTWSEFADWYLEITKAEDYETDGQVALTVLETILKLLHPYMPFVTEAIWTEMKHEEPLIVAEWPVPGEPGTQNLEPRIEKLKEAVRAVRNLRATYQIAYSKKLTVSSSEKYQKDLEGELAWIQKLAGIGEWRFQESGRRLSSSPTSEELALSAGGIKFNVEAKGLIDKKREIEKREKETAKLEGLILSLEKKLKNKKFLDQAPAEVIDKEKTKIKEFKEKMQILQSEIQILA